MPKKTVAQNKINQSKNIQIHERPRGRPRQFSREDGLRRAMRLFWKQGYEATSMADLRASLGITQASLYAAYASKEALFREAVDLYLRTDGDTTERALRQPGSTRDAVRAMLQDAVDAFTMRGAPGGCLLVLGAVNCAAENKGVQRHLASLRRQTVERVTGRLEAARTSGELTSDVPTEDLADYYTTVLHGLSLAARDGASRPRLTGIVNLAMRAWPEARQ